MTVTNLAPGVVLGRYELGTLLGEGGMARVFRATDRELSRPVALKVLNFALSRQDEHRSRFLREARVMAALAHENIVRVYDAGEQDQWAYMAMELVEGETLDRRLEEEPQPSLGWVVDTMRGILAALDYVHARDIIHRDIKPGNILLGADDQVKLVDFGLVKVSDSMNVTRVGIRLGTPRYMSPEAAAGEAVTYQSDLFSVAMVFHELLTGRLPIEEIRDQAAYDRLKNGITMQPSRFRPGLPEEFDRIIVRALAFKAWDRYDSARKFSDAIAKVKLPDDDPEPRVERDPDSPPSSKKKDGVHTVVQDVKTGGKDNTVIEQFEKVKGEGKARDDHRKRHRKKSHRRKRRRWPVALAVLIAGLGVLMVALVLFVVKPSGPKPLPDPTLLASASGSASPSASPVPRPSPGAAGDPHAELAAARQIWGELSRQPGRSATPQGLQEALVGQRHLEAALAGIGPQSLKEGLGPDGRQEFLHLLERYDEAITRVRDIESLSKGMMVEEALLGNIIDIRQRLAGRNARLIMLDRLAAREGSDPSYWELASRCAFRVGMMVPAVIARYRWQEASAQERLAKHQPELQVGDLKLLSRSDDVMLTISLPRAAGVNPISGARSPWTAAWDRLAAGLAGTVAADPSPAAAPSVAPKARPSAGSLEGEDDLGDLERAEDDILSPRARQSAAAPVARLAVRPRAHKMAAPSFAEIQNIVKSAKANPGTLQKALAQVVDQLGRLRACAKVDEAALEFHEPGQDGLYEELSTLHAELAREPRLEGSLRNQLLEYTETLHQLSEIPTDDAAYWIVYGQAALLCGHVGVAEDAFLHALSAPIAHPDGRRPGDPLSGPAFAGLARAVWNRCEISGDPGVHKPGLLDNSLMDLDLYRLHVLATALAAVPAPVRQAWSLTAQDLARIDDAAKKARAMLVKRALIAPR